MVIIFIFTTLMRINSLHVGFFHSSCKFIYKLPPKYFRNFFLLLMKTIFSIFSFHGDFHSMHCLMLATPAGRTKNRKKNSETKSQTEIVKNCTHANNNQLFNYCCSFFIFLNKKFQKHILASLFITHSLFVLFVFFLLENLTIHDYKVMNLNELN